MPQQSLWHSCLLRMSFPRAQMKSFQVFKPRYPRQQSAVMYQPKCSSQRIIPRWPHFSHNSQVSGRQAWPAEFSQRRSRYDASSLSPLPLLNPSEVESIAPTLNLIDVGVQNPSLNLRIFQPIVGDVNSNTGKTSGGDSSDAVMMEAIRQTTGASQFPSMPPPPDLQIQFNQAGIQPAPEPSSIALGSLALGLIALTRLNRRQRILKLMVFAVKRQPS